jgi:hypothetical protein
LAASSRQTKQKYEAHSFWEEFEAVPPRRSMPVRFFNRKVAMTQGRQEYQGRGLDFAVSLVLASLRLGDLATWRLGVIPCRDCVHDDLLAEQLTLAESCPVYE